VIDEEQPAQVIGFVLQATGEEASTADLDGRPGFVHATDGR
jgi:hypothetical protein